MPSLLLRFLSRLRHQADAKQPFAPPTDVTQDATRRKRRISLSARFRRVPSPLRESQTNQELPRIEETRDHDDVDEMDPFDTGVKRLSLDGANDYERATPSTVVASLEESPKEIWVTVEKGGCSSPEPDCLELEMSVAADALVPDDICGGPTPEFQTKLATAAGNFITPVVDGKMELPSEDDAEELLPTRSDWPSLRWELEHYLQNSPTDSPSFLLDRLLSLPSLTPAYFVETISPILPELHQWAVQHSQLDHLQPTIQQIISTWLDSILAGMPAQHEVFESTLHRQLHAWRSDCSCLHCYRLTGFLEKDFPRNPYVMGTVGAMNRWHIEDKLKRFIRKYPGLATWKAMHGYGPDCSMWMVSNLCMIAAQYVDVRNAID